MNYFEYMASYIRSGGPCVCLPVVELTTVPGSDAVSELTDTENARMHEVAAMGLPILVKYSVHDINTIMLMSPVREGGETRGYIGLQALAADEIVRLILSCETDKWVTLIVHQ